MKSRNAVVLALLATLSLSGCAAKDFNKESSVNFLNKLSNTVSTNAKYIADTASAIDSDDAKSVADTANQVKGAADTGNDLLHSFTDSAKKATGQGMKPMTADQVQELLKNGKKSDGVYTLDDLKNMFTNI